MSVAVVPHGGLLRALPRLAGASLIHVHEGRSVKLAWLNRGLRGAPYLITRRVQQGPGRHWVNRQAYRAAAALVVLSKSIGRSLERLDPGLDYTVIPSAHSDLAVDRAEAVRLRSRFGGDFVVGHVGALIDEHKGQQLIIELARRQPGIVFVLVGSGRDEPVLRKAAARLGNLRFVGQVSNVGDCLAAFDLFIYPSRHEGLGSILLDALKQGLPVLASDAGGIPELIVDGLNGRVVPVGDVDALERALLELHDDDELRARISDRNREAALHHGARTMAERYMAIYQKILGG
ncbi:MAG: glycosyltransferase [Chromatiales bacterium]|nr:glycosyltransferase [Chromatiales bacterium]